MQKDDACYLTLKAALRVLKNTKTHTLPVDIHKIVNDYGIFITSLKHAIKRNVVLDGDEGYTLCRTVGNSRVFIIVVNDDLPVPYQRFIIAHELGHIVLGHFGNNSLSAENEADSFATALLVPLPFAFSFTAQELAANCIVPKDVATVALNNARKVFNNSLLTAYKHQFNNEVSTELCFVA